VPAVEGGPAARRPRLVPRDQARRLPVCAALEARKAKLGRLLKRAPTGIALNEHHEGDGPALFAAACARGLEGIVSKRIGSRYRSGRSDDWRKSKNPVSAGHVA